MTASLFDLTETVPRPSFSDAVTLPGPEASNIFVDLREWYEANPRVRIAPDPGTYSKQALAQLPQLEWLSRVDIQLVYPMAATLDEQLAQLGQFIEILRSECIRVDSTFCPEFPAGFDEPVVALDTETTGLDTRVLYDLGGVLDPKVLIVGLVLAPSGDKSYYLPVRHTQEDGVPNWLPEAISWAIDRIHDTFMVVCHNANYDREVCALNGVKVFRPWPYYQCTQILDYFHDVNQKSHGLKACAERYLGRKMVEIQELFYGMGSKKAKTNHIRFDDLAATTATVYAGADGCNTWALFAFYAGQPEGLNVFRHQSKPLDIDHRLSEVRRKLVRPGMPVNFYYNYYAALDAIYRVRMVEDYLKTLVGRDIELGSPKQISALLFEELKLAPIDEKGDPAEKGKAGYYSTGEEVLDKLFERYPDVLILRYVVLWRKIQSTLGKAYLKCLANGYVDGFLPYTRVGLSFSQTNVPTGRLSSNSSDGAERVTLKISGKNNDRKNHTYHAGDWTFGANSQGVPNQSFRRKKAKRIKKLPESAGIDLNNLYPEWVRKEFFLQLAQL